MAPSSVTHSASTKSHYVALDSSGCVHPGHRGRGVGSVLLGLIEARAGEQAALAPPGERVRLCHAITSSDAAARAMLERSGYALVRHFRHMEIDLRGDETPPEPPDGIAIRAFDPDADAMAVHAVILESFRQQWGFAATPFDEWVAVEMGGPNADPSLWFLAADGEQIAGALIAKAWGGARVDLGPRRPAVAAAPGHRDVPAPPRLRGVRQARVLAGHAERRRGQRDRRDPAVRARRHAGPAGLGPLREDAPRVRASRPSPPR